MSEELRVCIDKELPEGKLAEAAEMAIAENPANAPTAPVFQFVRHQSPPVFHPVFMALITGKKWLPGRTLKIGFLQGTAAQHAQVAQFAKEWEQYANIKFEFGGTQPELRISFRTNDGAWSYLGTDNLGIARNQPTMNLGWLDKAVVLHEFGHALGCIHEHQNPAGGIQWNKEAAYEFYGRNGWTRQMVDQQVFAKYAQNITQFTATDPNSIMMYPIPAGLTTNGFVTEGGKVLSPVDRAYIATMYPGVISPPPPPPPPPPTGDWRAKVTQARDLLSAALAVATPNPFEPASGSDDRCV